MQLLRPLLKEWLDANLPAIVQQEVQREVRRILAIVEPGITTGAANDKRFHHRIDAVVIHPVWGLVILAAVMCIDMVLKE